MLSLLKNRPYAALFAAQVIALIGTGLMSVALALLAYDLAGEKAGAVLGTALAIKMLAYVFLSPVMTALTAQLPRKRVMVLADVARASVALALPFVDQVWQVYGLIFLLQAASATFTPTYQATLPEVLPDEADYTRALSLSRIAYEAETLVSPMLAAALLSVMGFSTLFVGTVIGFVLSALLVLSAGLPEQMAAEPTPFRQRLTRGMRLYLATPRLRGLLAMNMAVASVGAFVLVNSVVLVKADLGRDDRALALLMAAFGAGSILAALALPRVLDRLGDRAVMQAGSWGLSGTALVLAATMALTGLPGWPILLAVWALFGIGWSLVLTPTGRLLRQSGGATDRPALFAAQFALSHACWLLAYPLAGRAGQAVGLTAALAALGAIAALATLLARHLWPSTPTTKTAKTR